MGYIIHFTRYPIGVWLDTNNKEVLYGRREMLLL